MNIATILVGAAVAALLILVIWRMATNRKKGKSACGCGCSSCPHQEKCGDH